MASGVPAFIDNPRRAPRVPILLDADVTQADSAWQAVAVDFGAGGCLLLPGRAVDDRSRLILEVRTWDLPDVLTVSGSIAWRAGARCGVRFGSAPRGLDPREWFLRLLATRPHLREIVSRAPSRIALDAVASRRRTLDAFRLTPDEERVLSHVRSRTRIGAVQHHARLPPHYFARALFSLVERGLIVVAQPLALTPTALPRAVR